jgi:hypothetical protein
METAAFNKKKALFPSKIDLKLRKKLVNCYIWSTVLHCADLDTSGSRSEIPLKF